LNFFTWELKNIFLKIEVKKKKWQAFKILNNSLLINLPFPKSPGSLHIHINNGCMDAWMHGTSNHAVMQSYNHAVMQWGILLFKARKLG